MSKTPGQICYEAYLCACGTPDYRRWDELRHSLQQRWEAAAQAVLAGVLQQAMSLLYVVVMQEGGQTQLCGAYPNADEAGIHLAHARTIMPDRHLEIRICPFALTGQTHRLEAPHG